MDDINISLFRNWGHNIAQGGGITLHRVGELFAVSRVSEQSANALKEAVLGPEAETIGAQSVIVQNDLS